MQEFHAILVDKSLNNLELLNNLTVLSEAPAGSWTLYKIIEKEDKLIETIKTIQSQMLDGPWYFHFYNSDGSKVIVVFKDNFFVTDNNPINWSEILAYGNQVGTPAEQLDFIPNRFQDEEF